jgi:pyridoxine kinase
VLGDEGKLYVSQELVAAYKATLVPLANILTPNQFEAECLTGLEVKSKAQALQAAAVLHDMGPHTVVSVLIVCF